MKGKTITAASLAFVLALGLSACGQDDPAEEASEQAQEASETSQYMGGEGSNAAAEDDVEQPGNQNGAMSSDGDATSDSGTMQGMNEASDGMESDGMEKDSDESMSTREGGTAHTATNVNSSGAMTQAEESRNLDN